MQDVDYLQLLADECDFEYWRLVRPEVLKGFDFVSNEISDHANLAGPSVQHRNFGYAFSDEELNIPVVKAFCEKFLEKLGFMNIFSEKKNIENSAYILVRSEECRAINKDFEIQNNLNILPGKLQASASYRKEVMFNVIQLSN